LAGRTGARRALGWTGTDWLVALLAVVVLALSMLGMFWLFGPLSD
jgi:HAMP domain-containing protein